MPAAMTFQSLLDDASKYLERGGVSDHEVRSQIPALINTCERRIARDMKVEGLQATVVTTMKAGVSVYAKPDRWRDTISINFGIGPQRTPLFTRSYEYIRNYWPNESATGIPRFYGDYDDTHWLIAPTPSVDYPMEILYHQMEQLLDQNNQTNWITKYAPNLLLYGTLSELALFTRAYDQVAIWDGKYKESLAAINGEDTRKMADRNATRQGA